MTVVGFAEAQGSKKPIESVKVADRVPQHSYVCRLESFTLPGKTIRSIRDAFVKELRSSNLVLDQPHFLPLPGSGFAVLAAARNRSTWRVMLVAPNRSIDPKAHSRVTSRIAYRYMLEDYRHHGIPEGHADDMIDYADATAQLLVFAYSDTPSGRLIRKLSEDDLKALSLSRRLACR